MSLSCEELLNIFDKIGGKLKVDYYTEKAILYPQNISCNIKSNNSKHLDKLVDESYLMKEYDEDGFDFGLYYLPKNTNKQDGCKLFFVFDFRTCAFNIIQSLIDFVFEFRSSFFSSLKHRN